MALDREPRYVGTIAHPIQVDKSFFSCRRKYGRIRYQFSDTSYSRKKNLGSEVDIGNGELEGWTDSMKLVDSSHDGAILNESVSDCL